MTQGTGVAESKVSRIVWHGILTGDTQPCIAEAEITVGSNFTGYIHQWVAFPIGGAGIKCIIQQHIFVQWIVLGRGGFFGVGEINGRSQFGFLGKEASKVECSSEAVLIVVIQTAFTDTLFQSAETGCFHVSGQIDATYIRELHIEIALCSPTTFFIEFSETQFVYPDFCRLDSTRIIANSDHQGLYLCQRRITNYTYFVSRLIRIVFGIDFGIGYTTIWNILQAIARLFCIGQHTEVDIQIIWLRPDGKATGSGASIIFSVGSECEWNFVFIIIATIVWTETDKYGEFTVLWVSTEIG